MKVGRNVKEARKKLGLSQLQLAEMSGITQPALAKIERGGRPSVETEKALSAALGVSVAWLYFHDWECEDFPGKDESPAVHVLPIIKDLLEKII